jgi:UDP:flavonoid glycosyltransferase YjiC (YdhE family)
MPESFNVLFTFAGGAGHLTPMLPFAAALRTAGHVTGLAGQENVVQRATGFDPVFPYAHSYRVGDSEPTGDLVQPDLESEFAVIGDYFVSQLGRVNFDRVRSVIDRWEPDLIICDEMDFGAMMAAEKAGVPRVIVKVIASGALTRPLYVESALRELRGHAGLSDDESMARLDDDVVLSPFPASFRDPRFPLPANAIYARGSQPSRPEESSDAVEWFRSGDNTQSRIYFTLGTIFNTESGDLFERVIDGLTATGGRVLVTVGPNIDPTSIRNTHGNVRIERFVEQDSILDSADLVVNHGGSGSVIGALSHGIPVVVLPMGADQELNGQRVEALGVGTVIDPITSTPEQIAKTALAVLASDTILDAVARMREEIARLPSPETAVGPIVQLVRESREQSHTSKS